ncbi:tetratricopeptide repeat protein [Rubrivivax rivuli]|uniref:Tetratricopeptide repeat protein n=1 Tax=Rubrivivax rivuli TaxID=1862385 RepID=A0A437RBS8_9BURK|nr:tetratricopeptide repeat protein [Rubrivivax rivuli]RVU44230.1 tetratricopeptide repeat protein [Rubrivivax rivuli]
MLDFAALHAWLDVGQAQRVLPHLEALRAAAAAPDGADAGLVLVRALRQLGAERESDALALRLGRRHPRHAEAVLAQWRTALSNQGAYLYWRLTQRPVQPRWEAPSEHAGRLSLRGLWLGGLRDDEAALACQREALALQPADPWLWVEHSYTLTQIDRREAALEAAQQALHLCPGHRTGTLQTARVLQQLGRLDEATALLEAALAGAESAAYAWALHGMAQDAQQDTRALTLVARTEAALPLADKPWRAVLAARRADAWLNLGDVAAAREAAAQVGGTGFYPRLAERLADFPSEALGSTAPQRTLIPLAIVTQHWMTCAPATLTALARHWGREADHLEVAQAICYDGTPQASEREWAVAQGFWVRECKLDWPTACALVHAGVPFALATQHVGSGHLQAVVGCDLLRKTLLVRDPSLPLHAEYEAEKLFDAQQAAGPRAMVMLPPEELPRLEGIELPEAPLWDLGHAVLAGLQRHDRPAAAAALTALQAQAPDSDSAWRAQRHIAIYDGDEPRILAATEKLLARYPNDSSLQLSRLSSLFEVHGQAAGEAYMAELVARPWPDPLLLARWAARLAQDGRRLQQAFTAVRRALRRDGNNGRAWSELADLHWAALGSAAGAVQACEPARICSTLMPTEEWAAAAYARACRVAGRTEEGLAWLRERERIWGDRSGRPALTLAEELDAQQRDLEAEAALAAALQRRPTDTPLRLALAERALYANRLDEAETLLAACAEADAHAPALLRLRALLQEARGALAPALAAAEEAVALEPLHLPHHRLLLRLLRRQHGDAQALALWRPRADAHPAHVGLQRLLYDALPDEAQAVWQQLDAMHRVHPGLPWLQRERAVQASRQGRHDEAVALARTALEHAPSAPMAHDVLAYCVQRRDGYAAALPLLHEALRRDIETEAALYRLLQAPDAQAQRNATDFVAEQIGQQMLLGDGLLIFQSEAGQAWPPAQVLALLQAQQLRWPGLWHGPVAVARQLMQMQRLDEALDLLASAAERFPLLPRVHLERAEALRLAGRIDEALQANAQAIAISPGWNRALRLQTDLLCKHALKWDEAEALLQRALQTRDGWADADLTGLLAWVHEGQKRAVDSMAAARRALRLDPAQNWVWALVRRLCDAAETPAAFDAVIDEVVASRPGDAAAWLVRAERSRDDLQALQAAEQALALQPRQEAAWQARFERLLRLGRLDEIGTALQQLPWPDAAPVALRAWGPRLAWERAEHDAAVAALRALCAEAPNDEALCVMLADWLDERGDHHGYLAQAEALCALAPLEARSHGYRGHALVKLQRWAEALLPLQRALELAPGYVFAARQLAQAARAAAAPDLAEPALQALWPHMEDVGTACDGIELAVAARRPERAQAWLQRLFELDDFDIDRTREALRCWREAGWGDTLAPLQQAQVMRGGGPVGLVLDALDQEAARSGLGEGFITAARVTRRALQWQQGAEGPHLLLGLMRWLAVREQAQLLGWVLRRCENRLRADDRCWGEASYALCSLHEFRAVVRWLHDWPQRERAPAYAMANLGGSLVVLRQWDALQAAVQQTLQRLPEQEDMRLWQLLLHARAGDLPALQAALQRCHEWTPDPWMRPLLNATEAFVALALARAEGGTVAALLATAPHGGPPQAWAMWRELRRMALLRHTPWPRLGRWLLAG